MSKKTIEIIARGVLNWRGKVLLCRNRELGHLFLPGGHVDFAEAARGALEREIREELGVKLSAGRFLGATEACFCQPGKSAAAGSGSKGRQRHHEINLVFELRPPPTRDGVTSFIPSHLHSRERHIEFLWATAEEYSRAADGFVVLPPSIVKLIILADDAANPTRRPIPPTSDWLSDWE